MTTENVKPDKSEKSKVLKNLLKNANPYFSFKCHEKVFTEEIARATCGLIRHTEFRGWLIFDPASGKFINSVKLVKLYAGEMAKRFLKMAADKIKDEEIRTAVIKFGVKLLSAHGIANIETLLRNEQETSADEDDFNNKAHIINCQGEVCGIDGTRRKAEPGDFFLMSTSVKPAEGTPEKFLAFMEWFARGDAELKEWLLTVMATALFGFPSRLIINLYGQGQNGKGTLLRLLFHIIGDYATTLPRSLVIKSRFTNSRFDKSDLPGKTLAVLMDLKPELGDKWNLDELKSICGDGDIITIERKMQPLFNAALICKVFISTNDQIPIDSFGESERSRFRLVPCLAHVDEPDPGLEDALVGEYPQILNLLLEYAVRWNENGRKLPPCKVVDIETSGFFDKQDILGQFLADKCVLGEGLRVAKTELFAAYKTYLFEEQGISKFGKKMNNFAALLEKRGIFEGFPKIDGKTVRVFKGVCLSNNSTVPQENLKNELVSNNNSPWEKNSKFENSCGNVESKSGTTTKTSLEYSSEEQKQLWEDPKSFIY
jgi:putative DNA primase/helicase